MTRRAKEDALLAEVTLLVPAGVSGGFRMAVDRLESYLVGQGVTVEIIAVSSGLRYLTDLRGVLRRCRRAPVVHIHGYSVRLLGIAVLLRNQPHLTTHHGYHRTCFNGLKFKTTGLPCSANRVCGECVGAERWVQVLRFGVARILEVFDRGPHVAVSSSQAALLGLNSIVPNVMPLQRQCARQHDTSSIGLLSAGRFVAEKGFNDLITALAEIASDKRPRLVLVGDGPCRKALQTQVQELGLANFVRILPWLSEGEVAELLDRAEVVVIPTRFPESFSYFALESALSGCSIIATSNGAVQETICGMGRFVPVADSDALAEALLDPPPVPSVARLREEIKMRNEVTLSMYQAVLQRAWLLDD